ncbi:uromodulin [Pelobates cultripes]|uniref:Uromodulin n=1 Tax=Pelobates cultripes TaxID=61616 RepID=A0AAD1SPD7_PELCU|nr:uromodulin [Pelobates cultripes]
MFVGRISTCYVLASYTVSICFTVVLSCGMHAAYQASRSLNSTNSSTTAYTSTVSSNTRTTSITITKTTTRAYNATSMSFATSNRSTSYYSNPYNGTTVYVNGSCMEQTAFPSLTFVVDTTGSMYYRLQQLVETTTRLLSRLYTNDTRQYTLVQFNDPYVGPVDITCSKSEFGSYVSNLYPLDGGDCPELAMTGLLYALQNSPNGSLILLATDASAKDFDNSSIVNDVFYLLEAKQAKVIFLSSGYCSTPDSQDFLIYRNIASASFGHVFQNAYYPDVVDFLDVLLQLRKNSTTKLLSIDVNNTTYSSSFTVYSNFSTIVISSNGQINSLQIVGPSGIYSPVKEIVRQTWGSLWIVENPTFGRWSMNINASGFYSIRVQGLKVNNISYPDICSKCHSNATCTKNLYTMQCTCNDGFVGDGYTCSDYNECRYYWSNPCYPYTCINTYGSYYCICPSGYEMSNKTCTDIDECSRPDLNSCHRLANCTNYGGSYTCLCPSGYFGDGYHCEFDECSTGICGFGNDCIKLNGSYSCLDPCFNATILNEPWRSTSNYYYPYYYYYSSSYYGQCDSSLYGWYRFTGSGGTRMPEFCPSTYSCYTSAPMWLSGSHPAVADGIVNHTACANWYGDCCSWSRSVQIKACSQGFHVYKFSGAPTCNLAYCTDPSSTMDSCSCGDEEECRYVNGHFGCYCKTSTEPLSLGTLSPALSCGANSMIVSFTKCRLQRLKLNTNTVHLLDANCTGSLNFNSTSVISVMSAPKKDSCGNQELKNATHVIYKNIIYLSLDTNSSVGGEDVFSITYSCAYPLDMQVSLETILSPMNSSIAVIEGSGQLVTSIALYQDSSLSTPYVGSEIILTSKTILHVGVFINGGDTSQFLLVMKNCYATPSRNASDPIKYDIIKNSCSSKQDSSITIYENGVSRRGRFSVQLFGYVQNSNVVFLHCDLRICDQRTETCTPSCSGSRSSTENTGNTNATVYIGPIIKQADSVVETVKPEIIQPGSGK